MKTHMKKCPTCLTLCDDLHTHLETCGVRRYKCPCCAMDFSTPRARSMHAGNCKPEFAPTRSSINGKFRMYVLKPEVNSPDYEDVLMDICPRIVEVIQHQPFSRLKFSLAMTLLGGKLVEDEPQDVTVRTTALESVITKNHSCEGIEEAVMKHINQIIDKIDKYVGNGSGWVIDQTAEVHLHITSIG